MERKDYHESRESQPIPAFQIVDNWGRYQQASWIECSTCEADPVDVLTCPKKCRKGYVKVAWVRCRTCDGNPVDVLTCTNNCLRGFMQELVNNSGGGPGGGGCSASGDGPGY